MYFRASRIIFLAEQAGLEPTPPCIRWNGLAIRCITSYDITVPCVRACATSKQPLRLNDTGLVARPPSRQALWRKMEDSNPQETIADLHVGFLDRCATITRIFRMFCGIAMSSIG